LSSGSGGEGDTPTVEQLQKTVADLTKSNEAILAKNTELLGETKVAKAAKKKADDLAALAAEDKAKANGDHEQLYKSAMQKNTELQDALDSVNSNIANEKVTNAAMKLSTELADGANAELLSTFISKRLKHTDEGIKVTDESGALTVSTMNDLKEIFKGDPRYASLLKGNQSSGGGAAGGDDKGGSAAKTITRAEHDALDAVAKAKFFKEGGKLVGS
jgi:hypothetical protein